ncbi:MAG: hypothetical protein LC657_15730, partial [Desulfobacteraceae bacterium]|nr:hypothetical protein [Desulfobacteraceae bacterium]
ESLAQEIKDAEAARTASEADINAVPGPDTQETDQDSDVDDPAPKTATPESETAETATDVQN